MKKKPKSTIRPLFAALITSLGILLIGSAAIFFQLNQTLLDNEKEMVEYYSEINNEIDSFIVQYSNLFQSINAYINLNERHDEEYINQLLEFITKDKLNEIRNVGIIQGSTIRWIYPLAGNEAAIGVDLLNVDKQKDDFLRSRDSMNPILIGPIDLIQGGQGFIIRTPIEKNNAYWGMISVVIKADVAYDIFEDSSANHNVELLITNKGKSTEVIFGNKALLDKKSMIFASNLSLTEWDIYIYPEKGWLETDYGILLTAFLTILLTVLFGMKIYRYFYKVTDVKITLNELQKKVLIDGFTGIYNKGFFDVKIEEEAASSDRKNSPISLIFFDIDNFKNVNDTYGHRVGDQVLLSVVKRVKEIIRINFIFFRWGGDEFAIILQDTSLEGAKIVAEKIKDEINKLSIIPNYKISASIGIAERANKEFINSWINRSDSALYEAKELGRNRVVSDNHIDSKDVFIPLSWHESYSSGNQSIDQEHLELIQLCNKFMEVFLKNSEPDVIRVLDELVQHIVHHFENEIKLLKDLGYPEARDHNRIHGELIHQTKLIYKNVLENTVEVKELFDFLKNSVVMEHLVKEDSKYYYLTNR